MHNELSELVAFLSKIGVFYRPEWTKLGTTWKLIFKYFQVQKWMLQTIRAVKVFEKYGVISLVSMFSFWVMVFELSKKIQFLQICADLARNLSLLKQFIFMHLKGLVTHFQKRVLFIMPWLSVLEILGFEVEEFCLNSTDSGSFFICQLLLFHEPLLRPL